MFWWHRVGWKNCCLWISAVKMTWIMNQNIYTPTQDGVGPKAVIIHRDFILFWRSKWMSRKQQNRDHNEQQKMLVQMSCYTGSLAIRSEKQNPPNTCTINISQRSHASWGFPTKSSSEATAVFVMCIHGCLRLEKPLDHGIVAVEGCQVQRCSASGAAARGQAAGRTQQNELRKTMRQFWRPKSKFWKLGPLNLFSGLKLILWFWYVLMTSSWLKKLLPLDFGSQDDVDNEPKHIYSNSGWSRTQSRYNS